MVAHKTWLISNDWMTIMLHGYTVLKITYLGTFSIKVCFHELMLRITNDQWNHRHLITNFARCTLFEPPLYWNNLRTGLELLWKSATNMLAINYKNMSACRLSTNTPSPEKSVSVEITISPWVRILISPLKKCPNRRARRSCIFFIVW